MRETKAGGRLLCRILKGGSGNNAHDKKNLPECARGRNLIYRAHCTVGTVMWFLPKCDFANSNFAIGLIQMAARLMIWRLHYFLLYQMAVRLIIWRLHICQKLSIPFWHICLVATPFSFQYSECLAKAQVLLAWPSIRHLLRPALKGKMRT